jgi:hypothetical protein
VHVKCLKCDVAVRVDKVCFADYHTEIGTAFLKTWCRVLVSFPTNCCLMEKCNTFFLKNIDFFHKACTKN